MPRHFFAVRPAEDAVHALSDLAAQVTAETGGRAVPAANVHLTLAFLGELTPEEIQRARSVADVVRGECFSLSLDSLGSFRRARVAWAGTRDVPPALMQVQSALEAGLRSAGFDLEERPFKPHVTLARKIERAPRSVAIAPIGWRVSDFVLMRSDPATGRYLALATWPLR